MPYFTEISIAPTSATDYQNAYNLLSYNSTGCEILRNVTAAYDYSAEHIEAYLPNAMQFIWGPLLTNLHDQLTLMDMRTFMSHYAGSILLATLAGIDAMLMLICLMIAGRRFATEASSILKRHPCSTTCYEGMGKPMFFGVFLFASHLLWVSAQLDVAYNDNKYGASLAAVDACSGAVSNPPEQNSIQGFPSYAIFALIPSVITLLSFWYPIIEKKWAVSSTRQRLLDSAVKDFDTFQDPISTKTESFVHRCRTCFWDSARHARIWCIGERMDSPAELAEHNEDAAL